MKLRLMDAKQTHGEQVLTEQLVVSSVEGGEQQVHGTLAVKESDIDLWWPNGMGNQPLYPLIIEFYTASDQKPSQAADGKRVQIGFRTVELIQTVDKDGQGSKFYFKINGKPMFAKGANFIPVDSFETRPDRHVYEDIITSCVEANMNMVTSFAFNAWRHYRIFFPSFVFGVVVSISTMISMNFVISMVFWSGKVLHKPKQLEVLLNS